MGTGRRVKLGKHCIRRVKSGSGNRRKKSGEAGRRKGIGLAATLGFERKRQTGIFRREKGYGD